MEKEKNNNYKAFIVPVVAVAIFTLLIFGAGYAYFAATVNVDNVANISTQLPNSGTTFVVETTECSINVTAANMVQNQANNYTGSNTCNLNITLTGQAGVSCTYNVVLEETGTTYVPTSNIPSGKIEFSGLATKSGTGATLDLASTETAMNTLANQRIAHGTMTLTSTTLTHSYTFTEKWYNLNVDQSKYGNPEQSRANEEYKYSLKVQDVMC